MNSSRPPVIQASAGQVVFQCDDFVLKATDKKLSWEFGGEYPCLVATVSGEWLRHTGLAGGYASG